MATARFDGKNVLVTGAADGIGRETALAFARAGADLILTDINQEKLEQTAEEIRGMGREVMSRLVDVSDREAMRSFADQVHANHDAVDVLVNNAGVGHGGGMLDTSLEDWDWLVSINLMGVVHGCHFFVPAMVASGGWGHVVNLSSGAGFIAGPRIAAYGATKYAVLGLTEALREELRPHGIGVTAVCPGIIATSIVETGRLRGDLGDPEVRERVLQMYRNARSGPGKVAGAILRAVAANRGVIPVSKEAWISYYLKRLFPRFAPRFQGWAMERRAGL
jgi:NAD(P)-dependent dehydrogenase (short-subunit alcohol dehydrogenase family)